MGKFRISLEATGNSLRAMFLSSPLPPALPSFASRSHSSTIFQQVILASAFSIRSLTSALPPSLNFLLPLAQNEHDMISALMTQSYKNGRQISDLEIAHMMIALLMAGQHTSSATGSWAMLRLASKPSIIEEIYQEQKQVYGNPDGSFKPLNYGDQKSNVPILDSVVRETLRLHPPIHSIMRKVLEDIPVPTSISTSNSSNGKGDGIPYVIPKGHFVMAAPGVSQVDPKIWKDSLDFNPKRWFGKGDEVEEDKNDETVDYGWGAVSSGANSPYLPFGAGR